MCSPKWPEALGPDAERQMLQALTSVAERSFFAVVEPCDRGRFAELAGTDPRWLTATIDFTCPACAGQLACTLPEKLAVALFDAFTGREPAGPPAAAQVADLLGELANMACGSWLTRLTSRAGFTLGTPVVTPAGGPGLAGPHLLLAVNDLPLAVELRAVHAAAVRV